jgi:translation machinery-associated protein 16
MAPSKTKKEKVFHPESRKAGQLARAALRKSKITEAASNRAKKYTSQGSPSSGHSERFDYDAF